MYAIIRDRGNQYKVSPGDVVEIDLLDNAKQGEGITFEDVLLTSNGDGAVQVGEPRVSGAKVSATVVGTAKGEKIDVVHFRRRKDSMSKTGHRQKYTRVKIDGIEGA